MKLKKRHITLALAVTGIALMIAGCDRITREDYQFPKNKVYKTRGGKYVAVLPQCNLPVKGRWTKADDIAAKQMGCSTVHNLGKMTNNPKDFVKPKRTRTHTAKPLVRSLKGYRNSGANSSGGASNGS